MNDEILCIFQDVGKKKKGENPSLRSFDENKVKRRKRVTPRIHIIIVLPDMLIFVACILLVNLPSGIHNVGNPNLSPGRLNGA